MRTTFIDTLCKLAEADSRIMLLTADLGFSVLEKFAQRFPKRFVNVGVAEQNLIGVAAGLAHSGKRVVTYSIVNFTTLRCLEQIRNDVCYHRANVVIVGVGAGYSYGTQGYTHHGIDDLSVMRVLPYLDVVVPGDAIEVSQLLPHLMRRQGPAYLRLGKVGEPQVHHAVPDVSRGRMLACRDGRDVAIIATGGILAEVIAAADELEELGISAAVWSCPWLKPFDSETLNELCAQFPVLATVEEGVLTGGLGAAVAMEIAVRSHTRPQLVTFGLAGDVVAPVALSHKSTLRKFGLDSAGIRDRLLVKIKQMRSANA